MSLYRIETYPATIKFSEIDDYDEEKVISHLSVRGVKFGYENEMRPVMGLLYQPTKDSTNSLSPQVVAADGESTIYTLPPIKYSWKKPPVIGDVYDEPMPDRHVFGEAINRDWRICDKARWICDN